MGQLISSIKYALNKKRLFMLGQWKSQHMPIEKMEDPIDFVVTWVDATDPVWRAEKEEYEGKTTSDTENNGEERYRDWEFFKYWFRAVEKYAPWVRNVYLVTYGHVPKWLDTHASKLKIVKHTEFIPHEYLPVFSCNPIELNLHRIKGLSEHFVYFNDDMFLNRPVQPEDFFRGGNPNYTAIAFPLRNGSNCGFEHMLFSTIGLINRSLPNVISHRMKEHPERWFAKEYDVHVCRNLHVFDEGYVHGMFFSHLGVPFRRSTLEAVWKEVPEAMIETSKHRFRTDKDIIHQVFSIWEMLKGDFNAVGMDFHGKFFYDLVKQKKEAIDAIRNERFRMICLNDTERVSCEEYIVLKQEICEAFENRLPNKSSFER